MKTKPAYLQEVSRELRMLGNEITEIMVAMRRSPITERELKGHDEFYEHLAQFMDRIKYETNATEAEAKVDES